MRRPASCAPTGTSCLPADSIHKPGFKLHTRILHHLFTIVSSGVIKAPLWDAEAKGVNAYPSNAAFVQEFVSSLLATSFPNMRPQQIHVRQASECVKAALLPSGRQALGMVCSEACWAAANIFELGLA